MSDDLRDDCKTRRGNGACRCGPCAVCGFGRHMAIHLPPDGATRGAKAYGHEFVATQAARQGGLLPILALLAAFAAPGYALTLGSAYVAVDNPSEWHEWDSSHHDQHFILGAAIGIPTYTVTRIVSESRTAGYVAATGAGMLIGSLYELQRGYDGSAYVDPVDALLWTGGGALAGAFLADMTGEAISLIVTPDSAAVGLAWEF